MKKKVAKKEKWAFDSSKLKQPKDKKMRIVKTGKFKTVIDHAMEFVDNCKDRTAGFSKIAKETGISKESVDHIGRILESEKIVNVVYPTAPFVDPKIIILNKPKQETTTVIPDKLKDNYVYSSDNIPVEIAIVEENGQKHYFMKSIEIGGYTKVFIDSMKERVAETFMVDISEISDSKKSEQLKKKFIEAASLKLREVVEELTEKELLLLSGIMLHDMYGLGKIELLMADNELEEVAINSVANPVTVYHRKHGWMKTNLRIDSEEEISNYASQIGRKIGREITVLNPILDAHLLSGDRVSATLFPVSSFGNTITIRKFARRPWTITDFISDSHTLSAEMAALLWLAIQYEMNVIVAGGTASGKTAMLNVLTTFMPSYHRILSIEDVREIMLPSYMKWNWVPLSTREPNPEGIGGISMLDLMQASLRMRPDRIIVGEIRRRREAEVLFEAMHTGHSVYSTIHANSGKQVVRRLTEPPIDLPPLEIEAIDLIVVQYRDRRSNARRTYEICTVEHGIGEETLNATTIYRWSPRNDSWDMVNEPRKIIEQLNLHTGMTENEIYEEINLRTKILNWMKNKKINDIEIVGNVIKKFYSDRDAVIKAVDKNLDESSLLV